MNQSKPVTGCPYLGILADPETRVEHADMLNHCFRVAKTLAVDLAYQEEFCVSDNFTNCEVYINAQVKEGSETIDLEAIEYESKKSRIALIGLGKGTEKQPVPGPVVVSDKVEEKKLPEDNDLKWKQKIHTEAQANYTQVASSRKYRRVWGLVMLLGLVMLVVFVWGAYNRYTNLIAQAQQSNNGNSNSSQVSIATAVSEMGMAANAWATAANAIEIGSNAQATRQAAAVSAAAALSNQVGVSATETVPDDALAACVDMDSVDFMLIEGPILSPNEGYYYVAGATEPDITATWIVENTGNCYWESVGFLSLYDGSIIEPVLKKDGEELIPVSPDGKVMILPGDQIEIVVPFEVTQARDINDEYIVIVNDISLVNLSHTILLVERWVIIINPTSQPVPPIKATPPNDKPPTSGEPSERPTPEPPPGRDP
jgi:hypothetical protein